MHFSYQQSVLAYVDIDSENNFVDDTLGSNEQFLVKIVF